MRYVFGALVGLVIFLGIVVLTGILTFIGLMLAKMLGLDAGLVMGILAFGLLAMLIGASAAHVDDD
jgi:amino acid transporter